MGNLTLNGSSSGSVTISPPAVAGTTTITIPATSGTMLVGSGGALSVSQGGTGVATLTANALVLGNGTGAVTSVAPGTSGNVLTSNGTTWISQAASSSGVTSLASADTSLTVSGSTGAVTVKQNLYTGTSFQNTSYPIGSIIVLADSNGSTSSSNYSVNKIVPQTIYTPANGATWSLSAVVFNSSQGTGSVAIAGTWQIRGTTGTAACVPALIIQRTA
jgi:hypothetical protein